MNEPIQQSGNEVSIVIYDAPLPPRYLKFSKKFIRTLFVVVPVALGLIFLTVLLIGLGHKIKDAPSPTLKNVMSDEEAKILALESEVKSLLDSNKSLQDKLSTQGGTVPTTGGTEEPFFLAIKKPYGMQNYMSENRVSLDQFELIQDQNKTSFKFVIISTTPETKVTGHVLVFMMSETGVMVYPSEANMAVAGGIKYSMGEPFSVSRLRPTNAEFLTRPGGANVRFMIYIFTREGDLLLIKETEPYKIGAKP